MFYWVCGFYLVKLKIFLLFKIDVKYRVVSPIWACRPDILKIDNL